MLSSAPPPSCTAQVRLHGTADPQAWEQTHRQLQHQGSGVQAWTVLFCFQRVILRAPAVEISGKWSPREGGALIGAHRRTTGTQAPLRRRTAFPIPGGVVFSSSQRACRRTT